MKSEIITVKKARKVLGKDAKDMSDSEIEDLIENLDILAKDALKLSREILLLKRDASRMANLIYDIYSEQGEKSK